MRNSLRCSPWRRRCFSLSPAVAAAPEVLPVFDLRVRRRAFMRQTTTMWLLFDYCIGYYDRIGHLLWSRIG